MLHIPLFITVTKSPSVCPNMLFDLCIKPLESEKKKIKIVFCYKHTLTLLLLLLL